ncbi:hypothetical protein DTO271G3_8709 [Paecilomyces variotii]|nr:hypothetical protein DTO271G3_8709 [Paecilomyces variotii]
MIEGYLPRVRAQTETAGRRHHTETPQPEGRPPIISCSVFSRTMTWLPRATIWAVLCRLFLWTAVFARSVRFVVYSPDKGGA